MGFEPWVFSVRQEKARAIKPIYFLELVIRGLKATDNTGSRIVRRGPEDPPHRDGG